MQTLEPLAERLDSGVKPDDRLLDGNLAIFVDPHGGVTGIVKWDYEAEATP